VRLLVIDESRVLPWVVERLAPPGVAVEVALDFDEAERVIREHRPDAAVVSIPPAQLPWREFQHLCGSQQPPVPVLYESCLLAAAGEFGIDPADGYAAFLEKPAPRERLQAAIQRLLEQARQPAATEESAAATLPA
jgi:DNA-binding NtrC family response regulator